MKLSHWFRRGVASLCAAALLCGGAAAYAAAPAPLPSPAEYALTNAAPSDAELKAALSKFTITRDADGGWQLDHPAEEASMDQKSCGLYPYMYLKDDGVSFSITLAYMGSKKLDLKKVTVTADKDTYEFTCDDTYDGGYDTDLGCWFDLEIFPLDDDEITWLTEWLNAKKVTAVFTGQDGSTQSYTLTKANLNAIQEMITAYNLITSSTVGQCTGVLTSLAS